MSAQHPLPKPDTQCGESGFPSRTELVDNRLPVCTASLGTANSGDRYAEFLDRADDDDFGTYPSSPLQQGSGGICTSRQPEDALLGPLRSMAEHPGGRISGCLNHRVLRCQNASDCPAFDPEIDAGHGDICRTWGQPGEGHGNFCASAIRVLMRPTEDRAVDELSEGNRQVFEEYCVASSVGEALARGCVVKRGKYEWRPCRSNDRSMELRWKELERRDPKFVFSEFQVAVAYRPAEDSGDDGPHSASGAP